MQRILIVKVTSMGDVIQTLPIVADLKAAFPGVKIDWVVDADFGGIVRLNQSVDRVFAVPLRKFKRERKFADLKKIGSLAIELRRERYDAVIDLHGVYKSAIITYLARSKHRYGYPTADLGESGAAFAYTKRFEPRGHSLNAWQGQRKTVSRALGYSFEQEPQYNLQIPGPVDLPLAKHHTPFVLFFHATSKQEKKWAIGNWQKLGKALAAEGITPFLPWGSELEKQEAQEIAAGIPRAVVLPRLTIEEMAQYIGAAKFVVGTDTGFSHLACALNKPVVAIFTATSRPHFSFDIPGRCISIGDEGKFPAFEDVEKTLEAIRVDLDRTRLLKLEQSMCY